MTKTVIVFSEDGSQTVMEGVISISPVLSDLFIEFLHAGGNKSTIFRASFIETIESELEDDGQQASEPQS